MGRTVSTVEKHGQKIRNKKVGTIGIIKGTDSMGYGGELLYGFKCYVPKEKQTLFLPFKNLNAWEVVGK